MQDFVIGVDGGGTKTVAWIAPLDDPPSSIILGRGKSGPGNPRSVGFETAQANIAAAIEAAFRDASIEPQPAVAACFGLAGAGRESEQLQIIEWAKNNEIARNLRVCGDAELVLAAASPTNEGIALISGTGSLAWGRNAAGQTGRSGGWGHLIGDEGSGYAIAIAALRSVVRAADGRDKDTLLSERLFTALRVHTPADLVQHVYSPKTTRADLAKLCEIVFEVAPIDPVAEEIVRRASAELAHMAAVLCLQLGLQDTPYVLALAGGLILNQPLLRTNLATPLSNLWCPPASTSLVEHPVRGALALARTAMS